jgi:hypothetical protein
MITGTIIQAGDNKYLDEMDETPTLTIEVSRNAIKNHPTNLIGASVQVHFEGEQDALHEELIFKLNEALKREAAALNRVQVLVSEIEELEQS